MIDRAALELSLELSSSKMIGDRLSDLEAARRAGVGTLVLLSSKLATGAAIGYADDAVKVASLHEASNLLFPGEPAAGENY
jgi:histidinol phosphatase-like enzyme